MERISPSMPVPSHLEATRQQDLMYPSRDSVCLYKQTHTFLFSPFLFFFHTWECATHTAPFLAFSLNNLLWLSLHISSPHSSSHLCQEVTFCCLSSPLSEDIYVVSDFLLYKLLQCLALNGWMGWGGMCSVEKYCPTAPYGGCTDSCYN